MSVDAVSGAVIGATIRVHTVLGPGLLERAYQACLAHELDRSGHCVRAQVPQPIVYDGIRIDAGYGLDLLVDGQIIVELEAVAKLLPIHQAQLLSYLRLSGCRVSLLINFHEYRLKDGIRRMVL